MPKYIVAGSQFNPFTYEEISRPLQESAKLHRETDDALSMLSMQTGTIGSRIGDGEDNKVAREMYDNYMNTVKSAADDLYNKGYNSVTAKALSNARAMYATKIAKLDAAIKNRDARIKEYNDMLRSDDTLISEFDPTSKGLDNWLANDNYGYFRKASGKTLMELGKQAGQNLKGQFMEKSGFSPAAGTGGYLLEQLTRTGLTSNDIDSAVRNIYNGTASDNPRINAAQKAIMDIYNNSDLSSWANEDQRIRAIGYIAQGLGSAIGDVKSEHTANEAAKEAADYNKIRLQYALKAAVSGKSGNGSGGGGNGTLSPFIPRAYHEEMRSSNFNEVSRKYNNRNVELPKKIKGRDGKLINFKNEEEANSYLTQLPLRQEASKLLGGIDVGDMRGGKQSGTIDGLKVDVKIDWSGNYYLEKEKYPGGPMVKDDNLTKTYNKYHSQYMNNEAELKEYNPDINLRKLPTSAESERKFRDWSGIDSEMGNAGRDYKKTSFTGTLSGSMLTTPDKYGKVMKDVMLGSINMNASVNDEDYNTRNGFTVKVGKRGTAGFSESVNKDLEEIFTDDNVYGFAVDGESLVNGGVKALTKDGKKVLVPWKLLGGHFYEEGNDPNYLALLDEYSKATTEEQRKRYEGKLAQYAQVVVSRALESYNRLGVFQGISGTSSKPLSYDVDQFNKDYIED